MITLATAYGDNEGNTYRIERASNKMFICVRTNKGGNRKVWKEVGAHRSLEKAQHVLNLKAKTNGWESKDNLPPSGGVPARPEKH